MEQATPRYSIVVPLFDEEQVVPDLVARLTSVLDALDGPWEIILVDDGSSDGTYGLAVELHTRDERLVVRVVERRRQRVEVGGDRGGTGPAERGHDVDALPRAGEEDGGH